MMYFWKFFSTGTERLKPSHSPVERVHRQTTDLAGDADVLCFLNEARVGKGQYNVPHYVIQGSLPPGNGLGMGWVHGSEKCYLGLLKRKSIFEKYLFVEKSWEMFGDVQLLGVQNLW